MTISKLPLPKGFGQNRIKVLLAHDEAFVGYSLAETLTSSGCEVIGPVFDLEFLQSLAVSKDPDVILVGDLELLSTTLILTLRGRYPSAVLIGFDTEASESGDLKSNIFVGTSRGFDAVFPGCLEKKHIISRMQILIARAGREQSHNTFPILNDKCGQPVSFCNPGTSG